MQAFVKLLGAGIAAILLSTQPRAETVPAASADRFVEFIGVQAQMNFKGTIWESQAPTWRARLGELGVRYVRSNVATIPFFRDNVTILYRNYGIRTLAQVQPRKSDRTLDPTQVGPDLRYIRDVIGPEKVVAILGPNEYSETKYLEGNTDWVSETRSFQRLLYTSVKSDPRLDHLPVVGPTIWFRIEADYKALGDLGAYTDFGNLHYYTGGRKPTLYARRVTYTGSTYESPMNQAIANAQITTPGSKIFVTETGFNVKKPNNQGYIPESASAKYTLRNVAEFFLRRDKVERISVFSLLDGDAIKVYGLLRNDMSRRPSFYAIKNAIAVLNDKGAAFSPRSLTYTLSGDRTDIHSLVLQKRDGRFYMLIWLDAASWDRNLLVERNPLRRLTLDISQHGFSSLKIYHPTALGMLDRNLGATPIKTISSPRSVTLDVPDHVMILEMAP